MPCSDGAMYPGHDAGGRAPAPAPRRMDGRSGGEGAGDQGGNVVVGSRGGVQERALYKKVDLQMLQAQRAAVHGAVPHGRPERVAPQVERTWQQVVARVPVVPRTQVSSSEQLHAPVAVPVHVSRNVAVKAVTPVAAAPAPAPRHSANQRPASGQEKEAKRKGRNQNGWQRSNGSDQKERAGGIKPGVAATLVNHGSAASLVCHAVSTGFFSRGREGHVRVITKLRTLALSAAQKSHNLYSEVKKKGEGKVYRQLPPHIVPNVEPSADSMRHAYRYATVRSTFRSCTDRRGERTEDVQKQERDTVEGEDALPAPGMDMSSQQVLVVDNNVAERVVGETLSQLADATQEAHIQGPSLERVLSLVAAGLREKRDSERVARMGGGVGHEAYPWRYTLQERVFAAPLVYLVAGRDWEGLYANVLDTWKWELPRVMETVHEDKRDGEPGPSVISQDGVPSSGYVAPPQGVGATGTGAEDEAAADGHVGQVAPKSHFNREEAIMTGLKQVLYCMNAGMWCKETDVGVPPAEVFRLNVGMFNEAVDEVQRLQRDDRDIIQHVKSDVTVFGEAGAFVRTCRIVREESSESEYDSSGDSDEDEYDDSDSDSEDATSSTRDEFEQAPGRGSSDAFDMDIVETKSVEGGNDMLLIHGGSEDGSKQGQDGVTARVAAPQSGATNQAHDSGPGASGEATVLVDTRVSGASNAHTTQSAMHESYGNHSSDNLEPVGDDRVDEEEGEGEEEEEEEEDDGVRDLTVLGFHARPSKFVDARFLQPALEFGIIQSQVDLFRQRPNMFRTMPRAFRVLATGVDLSLDLTSMLDDAIFGQFAEEMDALSQGSASAKLSALVDILPSSSVTSPFTGLWWDHDKRVSPYVRLLIRSCIKAFMAIQCVGGMGRVLYPGQEWRFGPGQPCRWNGAPPPFLTKDAGLDDAIEAFFMWIRAAPLRIAGTEPKVLKERASVTLVKGDSKDVGGVNSEQAGLVRVDVTHGAHVFEESVLCRLPDGSRISAYLLFVAVAEELRALLSRMAKRDASLRGSCGRLFNVEHVVGLLSALVNAPMCSPVQVAWGILRRDVFWRREVFVAMHWASWATCMAQLVAPAIRVPPDTVCASSPDTTEANIHDTSEQRTFFDTCSVLFDGLCAFGNTMNRKGELHHGAAQTAASVGALQDACSSCSVADICRFGTTSAMQANVKTVNNDEEAEMMTRSMGVSYYEALFTPHETLGVFALYSLLVHRYGSVRLSGDEYGVCSDMARGPTGARRYRRQRGHKGLLGVRSIMRTVERCQAASLNHWAREGLPWYVQRDRRNVTVETDGPVSEERRRQSTPPLAFDWQSGAYINGYRAGAHEDDYVFAMRLRDAGHGDGVPGDHAGDGRHEDGWVLPVVSPCLAYAAIRSSRGRVRSGVAPVQMTT